MKHPMARYVRLARNPDRSEGETRELLELYDEYEGRVPDAIRQFVEQHRQQQQDQTEQE